jgi:putative addiction module component (TIGR02574 family)
MSVVREQIANLTAAEQGKLLDKVWQSLEADLFTLTDTQRSELDARIERLEKNPPDVVPWEQVKSELFKQT